MKDDRRTALRTDPQAYARNRFRIGDHVRLSAEGRATFPRLRRATFTVVGFCREDDLVRIRHGQRAAVEYHVDYLELRT